MSASIKKIFLILEVIFFLAAVNSEQLPAAVKPCSTKDPELQNCILSEAQKYLKTFCDGIPELNIPSMDPMYIDHLSMNNAGLQLEIINGSLLGTKSAKFSEFSMDLIKKRGVIEQISDLKLKGKYKLDGKILILPINGNGDFLMDTKKLYTKVKYNFDILKGADDKQYLKIKSHSVVYDVQGNTHFDFKNLFNGNKLLGDTTLLFVNENWKIIMKEVATPAVLKIIAMYVEYMQKFFDMVPLEELMTSS